MSYLKNIIRLLFLVLVLMIPQSYSVEAVNNSPNNATGEIIGIIEDLRTSTLLKGAKIVLTHNGDSQTTTSDQNGKYEFRNLEAGEYIVTVEIENYHSATQNVVVNSGITTTNDFSLTKKPENLGNLIGKVTEGDADTPIEGALVTVGNGEKTYSQTTDSLGKYSINDLIIGDYEVEVTLENYEAEGPIPLSISKNETIKDFTLMRQKGDISGKIVNSKDKTALDSVKITLTDGKNNYTATTDTSGVFTINDINSGHYDMKATSPGFEDKQFTDLLIQSGNMINQDFELNEKFKSLSGFVKDGEGGNPLSGVQIFLSYGTNNYSTISDESGRYSFYALKPGEYTLTAKLDKYAMKSLNITIKDAEPKIQDIAISKPLGSISGRVTDSSTGDNVAGAKITATDGTSSYVTYSNSNGYYKFNDLELGKYKLTIEFNNYDIKTIEDIVVTDLDAVAKDIEIENSKGSLSGDVKDGSGNSLENAKIEMLNDDEHYTIKTDPDGNYDIDDIKEGKYDVIISKSNYEQKELFDLNIQGGRDLDRDFSLEAISGTVFGKVTDKNTGNPIESAYIEITNEDNTITILTDSNGDYSKDFVPSGNYRVIASADGYTKGFVDNIVVNKGDDTKADIALTKPVTMRRRLLTPEVNEKNTLELDELWPEDELWFEDDIDQEIQDPIIDPITNPMMRNFNLSTLPIITPEPEENSNISQPNVEIVDPSENVIRGTGTPDDIINVNFSDGMQMNTKVLNDGTWSIGVPELRAGDVLSINAEDPITRDTSADVNVSIINSLPSTGEYIDNYLESFVACFMILSVTINIFVTSLKKVK